MPLRAELTHAKASYPRVEPPCPYFGVCGGCSLQDLAYEDQLRLKRDRIERAFAGWPDLPSLEIVGLDEPWRYRNKAEFTFGQAEGRLTLGYHAAGSFSRIVDLDDCLLMPAVTGRLLRDVCALAEATGFPAYQSRTHQGFFRYLLVRVSHATGAPLLCLITAPGPRDAVEGIVREMVVRHPELSGVYWGVTARRADVAIPEELTLLYGSAYLEERIGPFWLTVHPLSFLQPTSVQADRMYRRLAEALGASPVERAWDLYCGIGVVGFYLSRGARRVYGIDVVPQHLELARRNAERNGIGNIEFHAGRVEEVLGDRRFWLTEAKPDLVVVDPPRAGLHPRALSSVLAARPQRVAYLSCNVQSLRRDLQGLTASFPRYHLTGLAAFDLFPHTDHVEVLAWLQR
jgi:23S rRNA (uracil1939-C5)-methyltransferase